MRVIAVLTVGLQLVVAAAAGAQTRVDLVPSATIGSIYDNNLFAQERGQRRSDARAPPGLRRRDHVAALRSRSATGPSTPSDRTSHRSTRSTRAGTRSADAPLPHDPGDDRRLRDPLRQNRRHPATSTSIPASSATVARRIGCEITPSVSHRVWPRTFAPDLATTWLTRAPDRERHRPPPHRAQRSDARIQRPYDAERRLHGPPVRRSLRDQPLEHGAGRRRAPRSAPGTRITLQAGPRFSTYRAVHPEVQVGFVRSTTHVRPGLRLLARRDDRARHPRPGRGRQPCGPRRVSADAAHRGRHAHRRVRTLPRSTTRRVTIYRGTLVTSWSPDAWYTVSGSYGLDYQLGDIRHGRVFLDGTEFIPDDRVLRHVLSRQPDRRAAFEPFNSAARSGGACERGNPMNRRLSASPLRVCA